MYRNSLLPNQSLPLYQRTLKKMGKIMTVLRQTIACASHAAVPLGTPKALALAFPAFQNPCPEGLIRELSLKSVKACTFKLLMIKVQT